MKILTPPNALIFRFFRNHIGWNHRCSIQEIVEELYNIKIHRNNEVEIDGWRTIFGRLISRLRKEQELWIARKKKMFYIPVEMEDYKEYIDSLESRYRGGKINAEYLKRFIKNEEWRQIIK